EEVAYVELSDLASIEGFDEETAQELQRRALDTIARIEAEHDARRKELGVADDLREVDGLTTAMMVKLGENDVKSLEDFAGCVPDDLVGWTERKEGQSTKHAGFLDGFELTKDEAEAMIMQARVKAGWIEAPVAEAEPELAEGDAEAEA
ncbi:MAG: transcription termination/antitermination protein NusA, partial [Phreatobacter sp.]|nr:transcription termination/antitermination protein NusA [Phreatobacter sp.]